MKTINQRSCTVCRKTTEKKFLLKFVRSLDGEILFDEKGQLPSRGAWLCPKAACMKKAFDKRLLFRNENTLELKSSEMIEAISIKIKKSILGSVGLLRKMGKIEIGREMVHQSLGISPIEVIILANDLSLRSKKWTEEKFNFSPVPRIFTDISKVELGKSVGKKETGVVALHKSRITDEILTKLAMLSEMNIKA